MISHNTDFIKELSNRAVFMDDGKIIDDSENIDEIVDNFIDFCHADYLKGDCWMFDVSVNRVLTMMDIIATISAWIGQRGADKFAMKILRTPQNKLMPPTSPILQNM